MRETHTLPANPAKIVERQVVEEYYRRGYWWFSGRILASHAGHPGSIPGQCSRVLGVCSHAKNHNVRFRLLELEASFLSSSGPLPLRMKSLLADCHAVCVLPLHSIPLPLPSLNTYCAYLLATGPRWL